jgi:hypothetical protein
MKNFWLNLVATAVVGTIGVLNSFAGYTGAGGSLNGGSFTSMTPGTGGNLAGDITVTNLITSFNPADRLGDFDAVTPGTEFFSGQYDFIGTTLGTSRTFTSNANWGTFSGTVTTDSFNSLGGGGESRTFVITGTFTPGSGIGTLPLPSRLGTLILTFSKATAGGSITRSWALDTTGSQVPEPASVAIFAFGAAGFAARRFRRK